MLPFSRLSNYPNNCKDSGKFTFACYIAYEDKEYVIQTHPTRVKDGTGAGDAFAAGFIYGLIKNKPVEECGLFGDIMAGFAIREMGPRKGLPVLSQLAQRYKERIGLNS